LEVVAKAIYLLNIYSGSSTCPTTVWIISGLRSRRKNVTAQELFFSWTQLQLRSSSFHEHGSGSGALLFHDSGSSSVFYLFSHINVLIVVVCLKLNGSFFSVSTHIHLKN